MNPLVLNHREQHTKYNLFRNINLMSIAYASRLGLGPTNPGMITIAQETLLFRPAGFSPALRLLVPAFSLPNAPQNLTVLLRCDRNAPLPLYKIQSISSVLRLAPLYLPRRIS